MKNLKFLLIFLLGMMFNVPVFAQWAKLSGPGGGPVYSIEYVGNQIWAACPGGIYISTDEGLTWNKSGLIDGYGVGTDISTSNDSTIICYSEFVFNGMGYDVNTNTISSINGGTTWSSPSLIENISTSPMGKIFRSKSTCIARTDYYNISYDFGLSWSVFTPPFGDHVNQIYSDGHTFLLQAANYSGNMEIQNFISTDAAVSWQAINFPAAVSSFYVEDNLLILGVYDTATSPNQYYIVRSSNLGSSWDTVYTGLPNQYFGDIRSSDGKIFISASDYQTLISDDDGLTWIIYAGPGYPFYSEVITFQNGDKIGIGEGGIIRYVSGPDVIVPANNGIAAQNIENLASNNNVLFASTENSLFRSTDAGLSWQNISIPDSPLYAMTFKGDTIFSIAGYHIGKSYDNGITWDTINIPGELNGDFSVNSIEFNNNKLYFSGLAMFYSDNLGHSWNSLPGLPVVPTNPCYSNSDVSGKLKSFEHDIFCITNDGFVFRLDTVAQSWQYSTCFWSSGAFNNNGLFQVDSALIVCGAGFQYSYDHGTTWITPAANGLSYLPSSIVSINGTWFCNNMVDGTWLSTDQGENWQPIQAGGSPFFPKGGIVNLNGGLFSGSFLSSVWRRAGTFESISGIVYNDVNNNGIKESTEVVIPNIIIHTSPSSWAVSSDTNGFYSFITDMAGDTLSPVKPHVFAVINPPYYLTDGAAVNKDFGVYMTPGIRDLSVDISNVSVFRPGFQTQLIINAKNNGSVKQPAQVQIEIDSNLSFISADPTPISISGNLYTWNIDSIAFLEYRNISIIVETDVFSLLNDSVKCTAMISPVIHDTIPANNYGTLNDVIVGSYDPNDKQCQQGEFVTPQQLQNGEEIIYTIRFQNTGNFQADFIHIIDTLCSYFDISTFRFISSSHPLTWSLLQDNVVDFYFQDIFLPPSSIDELNSHGFVKFGIKCRKSVALGNALTNTAYIYFDFNPAIVTNTTSTIIVNPIYVSIPEDFSNEGKANSISVYPNPASDNLYIDMSSLTETRLKLIIYNSSGSLIQEETVTNKLQKIQLEGNANGLYFGIIVNPANEQKVSFKFVIRK